jgi:XTP/dITP diphosphohydrolase
VTLEDYPEIAPPSEPGPDFRDNAAAKALYYHRATGVWSVGEDSGLVVDALGGEPGVHSARWLDAETPYAVKNQKLLDRLDGLASEARKARYVSAVALVQAGEVVFECEETCEGPIAPAARGNGGFGYDPIFFYPPLGRTLAEVSREEKNTVSHRGKAMKELLSYLRRTFIDEGR